MKRSAVTSTVLITALLASSLAVVSAPTAAIAASDGRAQMEEILAEHLAETGANPDPV
jgi:hypothetical protein